MKTTATYTKEKNYDSNSHGIRIINLCEDKEYSTIEITCDHCGNKGRVKISAYNKKPEHIRKLINYIDDQFEGDVLEFIETVERYF